MNHPLKPKLARLLRSTAQSFIDAHEGSPALSTREAIALRNDCDCLFALYADEGFDAELVYAELASEGGGRLEVSNKGGGE